ncbi:hypothetical protein [Streptacidiphilus sp. P02-A3a]|uniref:hypothetical protein n=1 Tax=Streptacidiphilus sp. P02-A3a TaxID=2704468 RepID=UPI0015FD7206|nr:hypothetical protein [Streptacidiphilus sp. P02-A3a]QMU66926.1 hypothetical protein GXP74_00535 [Streptacidiphilus sp. P02-A3a]
MSELTGPPAPVPTPPQPQAPPQPPPGGFPATMVWAVPAYLPPGPPRPWRRTALRWAIAAAVFLVVGAVTAAVMMVPARTDLPGLRTPSDHRYTFAPLRLPELPSGAAGPNEQGPASGNQTHAADLRRLLLTAPVGGKPDPGYPGASGWYSPTGFAAKFSDGDDLRKQFADHGLRHIAATAWTGPDGTRTEIYLLAYRSDTTVTALFSSEFDTMVPMAAPYVGEESDPFFPGVGSSNVMLAVEPAGTSAPAADVVWLDCADVEAVIVMTNPKAVTPATLTQVVTLQNDLLQG